jgi:hypothetical protein
MYRPAPTIGRGVYLEVTLHFRSPICALLPTLWSNWSAVGVHSTAHPQVLEWGESWTSVVLSKTLIFRSNNVLSIRSFQPTHGEMTLCGLLEMLDKQVVY